MSLADTPPEDLPQHLQALQKANSTRIRRADLLTRLEVGEITLEEVLTDWSTANLWVYDALRRQRRWGYQRTKRFLLECGIPEEKPCGSLTERQLYLILDTLERH